MRTTRSARLRTISRRSVSAGAVLQALVLSASVGCGGGDPEPERGGLAEAVGAAGHDTAVMRSAQDAVNSVVREATNCDAARPLIPDARAALDEAAAEARTPTAKTALAALRRQLENVENLCS